MIKRKTVFVLGAGASAPYNFPLGGSLVDRVLDGLLPSTPSRRSVFADSVREATGATRKETETFAEHLRGAGRYSIDEFLQWQPQYKEVGKAAIARVLMPCENDSALDFHAPAPPGQPDRRWYRYCFDGLLTSASGKCSLSSNNLRVITFNFDRSFERALFNFVRENCTVDRNDVEAARLTSAVPVYHIHGSLGVPDWLGIQEEAVCYRAYGHGVRKKSLQECAEAIRILDEEVERGPTLTNARDALAEAERVCFLGFSYHPTNLAKLRLHLLRHKEIRGTAFEMPAGPKRAVESAFGAANDSGIKLSPPGHDILTFLQETDVLFE